MPQDVIAITIACQPDFILKVSNSLVMGMHHSERNLPTCTIPTLPVHLQSTFQNGCQCAAWVKLRCFR
jgi:hypothetical protein